MSNDTPAVNKKDISYSPSLMSQIAMFPLKNPGDVRFVERTNGCVSVAVMQSMWGWTYGKIPRLFLFILVLWCKQAPTKWIWSTISSR